MFHQKGDLVDTSQATFSEYNEEISDNLSIFAFIKVSVYLLYIY